MSRILRLAMVGGGPGSFIGPVHRMAAELDVRIRLAAGVFSRDPVKNAQAAAAWGVAPDRVYPDHHAMIAAERARGDGVDLVSVVTPNHLHFDVSAAALRGGLHVISDKPATLNLAQIARLNEAADEAMRGAAGRAERRAEGAQIAHAGGGGFEDRETAQERLRAGLLGGDVEERAGDGYRVRLRGGRQGGCAVGTGCCVSRRGRL